MDVIVFSIPFFFLLIGAELAYSARSGRRLFRLNDSIADLSCGVISQLSGVFSKLFAIGIYAWAWRHLAVQRWLPAVPAWAEGAPFARVDAFPWLAANGRELAAGVAAFLLTDLA